MGHFNNMDLDEQQKEEFKQKVIEYALTFLLANFSSDESSDLKLTEEQLKNITDEIVVAFSIPLST